MINSKGVVKKIR